MIKISTIWRLWEKDLIYCSKNDKLVFNSISDPIIRCSSADDESFPFKIDSALCACVCLYWMVLAIRINSAGPIRRVRDTFGRRGQRFIIHMLGHNILDSIFLLLGSPAATQKVFNSRRVYISYESPKSFAKSTKVFFNTNGFLIGLYYLLGYSRGSKQTKHAVFFCSYGQRMGPAHHYHTYGLRGRSDP